MLIKLISGQKENKDHHKIISYTRRHKSVQTRSHIQLKYMYSHLVSMTIKPHSSKKKKKKKKKKTLSTLHVGKNFSSRHFEIFFFSFLFFTIK